MVFFSDNIVLCYNLPMNSNLYYLKLLFRLADNADKIALKYFNSVNLAIEYKKDQSPVSIADKAIEQSVRKIVSQRCPQLSVYGEEFGEEKNTANLRLIIDPIDGTRNFISGIPIFATLLAIEAQGEIIAGLVSAPALATRWWATKGNGAWGENKATKQKRQIFVSQQKNLKKAQAFYASIAGNEMPKTTQTNSPLTPLLKKRGINNSFQKNLLNLLTQTARQRGVGDFYQHMLVAQGSGEFAIDPIVSPWDIAPIKIIIEEAGGKFTSLNNKNSIYEGSAVSSNGLLHEEVLEILK